jgi:DNA-binding response OmpR family regulator
MDHSGSGAPRSAAAGRRILVVEDHLDAVRTLTYLLRDSGHDVQYAINGYVALTIARTFRPEIVLLDLGLPGINGFEVCTRLRREPGLEKTKIIAITAMGSAEDRARSRAAGCDLHLVKPVSPNALVALLDDTRG